LRASERRGTLLLRASPACELGDQMRGNYEALGA
jgi:hypothetical protein